MSEQKVGQESEPKNVKVLNIAGTTVRIILSDHEKPNTFAEVGKANAYIKEAFIPAELRKDGSEGFMAAFAMQFFATPQMRIISSPNSKIRTFYFVDIPESDDVYEEIKKEVVGNVLDRRKMIGGLGATLATGIIVAQGEGKEKFFSVPTALTGIFLNKALLAHLYIARGGESKIMSYILDESMPLTVKFRNLAMSVQVELIAKHRVSQGEEGEVAFGLGAAHGGIVHLFETGINERVVAMVSVLKSLVDSGKVSKENAEEILETVFIIPSIQKGKKIERLDLKSFLNIDDEVLKLS